jgi:tight adherence protein B
MLLPVLVFVVTLVLILGAYRFIVQQPGRDEQQRIEGRLRDIHVRTAVGEESVLAQGTAGPLPALERWLMETAPGARVGRFIEQSGVRTTIISMGGLSILAGGLGALLIWVFIRFPGEMYVGAAVGASLPWAYLWLKRGKRIRKFEEQFPEALDLLSRALRAGHAFQTGMGMVGEEMPPPVGPEFKKTFERQNFGLSVRDALDELSDRVPLVDVRFFVTAVSIQRETGGNLSEILDNLARVVRERFKLLRQVRVHTAHGRFTGYVLLALPAGLGLLLFRMNPDMMMPLFTTRGGQMMLFTAMILQTVGFFWIRKVINIEV